MNEKRPRYVPVSVFRKHPKLDDPTLIRLAYGFCQGISLDAMAAAYSVSRKTVRDVYLDFRARLKKAAFARWHRQNRILVHVVDPEADMLIRTAFVDVLNECAGNENCYKVFKRGNRAKRVCRACPLLGKFSSPEIIQEAVDMLDTIRNFYGQLGIRERNVDRTANFRERLIHTSVIAAVRENSKRLPNGMLDPADDEFLAIGQLMLVLMDDLIETSG